MNLFSSNQKKAFLLLLLIVGIGLFLRVHNFPTWLHFELDQSRDARVVDDAIRGDFFDLPLLGPKAGGTFLRLGPGFYYLEYLSALIFGDTPQGMAAFVLIFSVLSIPVFYLLVRRFFPWQWSLGLTLLFSVSEFFVMYGRFAWNPNLLPFFVLLGFYGLLRAVDEEEERRTCWFLLSVFSLALATHFHFVAFLALPAIALVFLLIKRPHFPWRTWITGLGIVALLYLPMVLNEIATGGRNTEEFFGAITEKSSKEDHSIVEKAIRNVSENALMGMVVVSGFEGGRFPSIKTDEGFTWKCDAKCDRGKWYGVAAVLTLGFAVLSLFWLWVKRDGNRRASDFLLLTGIWLAVSFVLFLPLAYGMAPRFFLLTAPIFMILLGFLLLVLKRLLRVRIAWVIPAAVILFFAVLPDTIFDIGLLAQNDEV